MNPVTSSGRMTSWLEHAWLNRYLDRELDEDECAWFEAYVLDKLDLIEHIEVDTILRNTLASASASGQAMPAPTPLPSRRGVWVRVLPIAATLVLGVGIGWLAVPKPTPPSLVADPTRLVFDTLRGTEVGARVEHADSRSEWVLVEVAVPPGAADVRVNVDGEVSRVTSSPDGFVSFVVPRSKLAPSTRASVRYDAVDGTRQRELSLVVPGSSP